MDALTTTEAQKLLELETDMERDREAFWRFGNNLAHIKTHELYREKYKSFDDYCKKRWSMSKRHVDRLIESSKIVDNLRNTSKTRPIGPDKEDVRSIPTTESQARELSKVPEDEQPEVWEEANERAEANGQKVTARHVKEVVDERTKSVDDEPQPTLDADGNEVPEELADEFGRQSHSEILSLLQTTHKRLVEYVAGDGHALRIHMKRLKDGVMAWEPLKDMMSQIRRHGKPHTICETCNGSKVEHGKPCVICKGRGWLGSGDKSKVTAA